MYFNYCFVLVKYFYYEILECSKVEPNLNIIDDQLNIITILHLKQNYFSVRSYSFLKI